jgi:diguanylate cyclase (GGDEF)-like protein
MAKKKGYSNKPSSLKSREELLEENILLYEEVLVAREAASLTANLVVEQFARMEEINQSLERANDELRKVSSLDCLLGIPNRRFHDEMMALEWRRCRRNRQCLTVIMVDIDYFKLFNDYYGHPAGDRCLKQVAETLQAVIHRSTDLVARYGGEEFVYTLSESDCHAAFSVAENARIAIEQLQIPHKKSKASAYVTISLGVASIVPKQSMNPSTLVQCADQALYQAKEKGRNRVEVYSESLE